MAPVMKTYQGRKPSLGIKVFPISNFKADSFDRIFGTRRTPHLFSSSSEASHSRSVFTSSESIRIFGTRRTPHVFSSSSEASHSRSVFPSSESISASSSSRLPESSNKIGKGTYDSATPKGVRKRISSKKIGIPSAENLKNWDPKRLKRACKRAEVMLKPLFESTPIKPFSPDTFICRLNFDRLRLEDSTDGTASAEPSSPVMDPSILDESSIAFAGFNSPELTASVLQRKYQWLDKKKSCVMVDETPRRARSMNDIILTSGGNGNLTQNSVDSACTVKPAPCKQVVTEKILVPISDIVPESSSVPMSREKMSLVGSSNSSLHSKHFITCDDLPQSSASSGESPDSCRSSDDLSRESFNERDEDSMVNRPIIPSPIPLLSFYEQRVLEPLQENLEDAEEESSSLSSKSSPAETPDSGSNRTPNMRRKSSRYSEERSPTGRSSIGRALATPDLNCVVEESDSDSISSDQAGEFRTLEHITLIPGKKYRRSLAIIRNLQSNQLIPKVNRGRQYTESVNEVIGRNSTYCGDVTGVSASPSPLPRWRLSTRRSSHMNQVTPPPRRRSAVRQTIYETPGSVFSCRNSIRCSLSFLLTSGHLEETYHQLGSPFQDSVRASLRPDVISPVSIASPDAPPAEPTPLDALFGICKQKDFVGFSSFLSPESYDGAFKIGEGVYGEVFSINRGDCMTVLKIIPLEGNFNVNDAEQKTYEEILPELLISLVLNDLRDGQIHRNYHKADNFVEIRRICLARGRYTPELLDLWTQFDEEKGSDNDNPSVFDDNQIYALIEQANGGTDLEHHTFSTAQQAVSIFKQIVFALAVAECAIEFEHRDLHWGNVLVSRTKEMKIVYQLEGEEYAVRANGVKATIIDYTLSRFTLKNRYPLCCDLSKDPDLFLGSGDYQFDVYRQMKRDVKNDWFRHVPKTNVRWLHYLVLKMQQVKFLRKTAKIHKESIRTLSEVPSWIEMCESASDVAKELVKRKV